MATVGVTVFDRDAHDLRGHDTARLSYMHRLAQSQVWAPRAIRPPTHQTLIIFDWDDTLLCTSWLHLAEEKGMLPHTMANEQLEGIEREVTKLLELAKKLGHVFIITNAMEGWVEYSAKRWVPGLMASLEGVPVISARSRFESMFPEDVSQWKTSAFFQVKEQLPNDIVTNLVSVGDAKYEMEAVHAISKGFDAALVKTVKFQETPTPEELFKQLELVNKQFQRIVLNGRNLKIGLERKK